MLSHSKLQYKEDVGQGTSVSETPEMERVKRNQQNISTVLHNVTLYPPVLYIHLPPSTTLPHSHLPPTHWHNNSPEQVFTSPLVVQTVMLPTSNPPRSDNTDGCYVTNIMCFFISQEKSVFNSMFCVGCAVLCCISVLLSFCNCL